MEEKNSSPNEDSPSAEHVHVSDQENKKSSNVLGYVIIIIVLIATIVAMLVYFFKTTDIKLRPKAQTTPVSQQLSSKSADSPNNQGLMTKNSLLEVISPIPDQKISSPVEVFGKSNFFEAGTSIKIKDNTGKILADTFTTAEGWMDKLYPFSKSVEYDIPSHTRGMVEVFEISAKDGSEVNKIKIPVIFKDFPAENLNNQNAQPDEELPDEAPFAELRTYTNPDPHYKITYPADWAIDNSKAVIDPNEDFQMLKLTIEKSGHKFLVEMPSAWGPGVCMFDDVDDFDGPNTGKLEGPAIKIKSGESRYKRTINPSISDDGTEAVWIICHKKEGDEQYSNHTPLQIITYSAPINYDSGMISMMDEMLKTIWTDNP